MAGYFDTDYLGMMGSVPSSVLTEFATANPGRLEAMAVAISRLMDSYLFKRYATPFADPVPEVVKFHGTQIMSHQLRIIIGFDPGSAQDEQIVKARDAAFAWLEQAANSRDGLVELPLREPAAGKGDTSGVSRRRARAFSYTKPMDWHRGQKDR